MDELDFDDDTPVRTVFEFAISKEMEAKIFYTKASEIMKDPGTKSMFSDLADVEAGHRAALQKSYKQSGGKGEAPSGVEDMGISEELVQTYLDPDMSPREAIELAIEKEKGAAQLYEYAESRFKEPKLRKLFKMLRDDELGHRRTLEDELNRSVYQEF